MKLKNLKKGDKGKKQSKTQQIKEKVQEDTSFPEDQQRTDDVLIDMKADINKKEEPKKNVKARMESNKLVENFIDTSKLVIQKKQEQKKPINSWVVDQKDVAKVMAKDFKLHEVQHQFESLTDTKVNEDIKKKKQKIDSEKKTETIGNFKFAPLNIGISLIDSKNPDNLVLGKPKNQFQSCIPFTQTKPLNFTNTKINENMNVTPIQKTFQQLKEEEFEQKQNERQQQRLKLTSEINPPAKGMSKGTWFKKSQPVKQPIKQTAPIEFKTSPWAFTNSNITPNQQEITIKAKPIQKSKQEEMLQRMQKADQGMKFMNKKQQEERRKKREEGTKIEMKVEKL